MLLVRTTLKLIQDDRRFPVCCWAILSPVHLLLRAYMASSHTFGHFKIKCFYPHSMSLCTKPNMLSRLQTTYYIYSMCLLLPFIYLWPPNRGVKNPWNWSKTQKVRFSWSAVHKSPLRRNDLVMQPVFINVTRWERGRVWLQHNQSLS